MEEKSGGQVPRIHPGLDWQPSGPQLQSHNEDSLTPRPGPRAGTSSNLRTLLEDSAICTKSRQSWTLEACPWVFLTDTQLSSNLGSFTFSLDSTEVKYGLRPVVCLLQEAFFFF